MKSKTLILLIVLGGLQFRAVAQQPTHISAPQKHYLSAKRLIEDNCIDCMGGTKAGMEKGIQEMQAALAAGFSSRKAAYKLLADAYNAMTTYSGNNEKEREAFEQKEGQILGELYRLDPLNSEFAMRYADMLKDKQEKLTIYKAVAERDAKQNDAAFSAGMLLIEMGKSPEGIQFISQAIRSQNDPEAVLNYAQGTLAILQDQNCPLAGAEEWTQKFGEAFEKATRGEGDPTAMPQVKRQFLEQLEKHRCKANR